MFNLTLVPTLEELSKLKIESFKKLLKTNAENAEMHYVILCMLLEVSVAYGLLDQQKYLQNYALEKKLEIEDDDLAGFFEKAIQCK